MANGTGQLYQIANLLRVPGQEAVKAEIESKEAGRKVDTEKAEQKNMLMELMEEELKKAQKKKSGGWLGDLGKIVSFINPIAGATLQGLSTGYQADRQKSALEKLSKSDKFKQYSGTWLSDPSKGYMKDVGKMSKEITPWQTALAKGVTSYGTGLKQKSFADSIREGGGIGGGGLKSLWKEGKGGPLENLVDKFKLDEEGKGKLSKVKGISKELLSLFDLLNKGGGQEVDENYEQYFGGL